MADLGIDRLRASVSEAADAHAPDVSQWTVGMHVHHCALGMVGISNSLLGSAPPAPPSRLSLPRAFVFATGRIPRGRGKAPEAALPSAGIGRDELMGLVDRSEELLGQVAEADPGQWWDHFAFGVMNRDQTLRFVGIHNRHHLRIIDDVRSSLR